MANRDARTIREFALAVNMTADELEDWLGRYSR